MSLSIITFADLGKRTNLKTIGILPVIEKFTAENTLDSIVCRTNTSFSFPRTRGILPIAIRGCLKALQYMTFGFFSARLAQEYLFDRFAYLLVASSPIVLFHPEYFFKKSLFQVKKKGAITIGIATMAHLETNARLEREEFELLGLKHSGPQGLYNRLLRGNTHLNDFDYIIALSDFVKDSYVAAGFPSSKIFVASSDLDTGQFFELNRVDNGKMFRVLYVAHTSILKGLHYLLNAWQMLDIPNKELTIVGVFKDMTSELRTIYNQALLDPTIKWTGNLERDVLLKYYASASVFVLPSLTEGNPRVVLEAMVARLPIITTMHARGLVQRGKSGFVVPIRDAQAIMEKLEFLYRHPDIAKQMGDEARRTVETKKPFGEAVFEIYESIQQTDKL